MGVCTDRVDETQVSSHVGIDATVGNFDQKTKHHPTPGDDASTAEGAPAESGGASIVRHDEQAAP